MRMIAAALLLTAVAEGAVAQYVDKSLGICAPQYFADTVQIAYDDPKAVYGLAPGPGPGGTPRRIVRTDLTTGAETTLRVLSPNANVEIGYTSFVVAPRQSNLLFAADEDDAAPGQFAIYRSSDRGTSWTKVLGALPYCVPKLIVSPDGLVVSYQGCSYNEGATSRNGGLTWNAPHLLSIPSSIAAFSAAHPEVVYTLNIVSGRRSSDRGQSWTPMAMRGYQGNLNFSLAVDGADPAIIYAVTNGNAGARFQISRNGGDDWMQLPYLGSGINLATSPDVGGLVYTTYFDPPGVAHYESFDYGRSWSRVYLEVSPSSCGRVGRMQVGLVSADGVPLYPENSALVLYDAPRAVPGPASYGAAGNYYGPITVTGVTDVGGGLVNFTGNAVITLGNTPGYIDSSLYIQFDSFDLAAGNTLTLRSGAPNQAVTLYSQNGALSTIAGALRAEGGNGAPPPAIFLINDQGIRVPASGSILAPAGLTMDAHISNFLGSPVSIEGPVDGGPSLSVYGDSIHGSGAMKGNAVLLSVLRNANNPVNGAHFLDNGLSLSPSTGSDVELVLNPHGYPHFINLKVNGNATVAMPSLWSGVPLLPNSPFVVAPGDILPAGTIEPGEGGSLIVSATGNLTLTSGATNDFVFAGGIVLKAGGTLDVNGVVVNQGWTTSGRAFQGIFLESPYIVSPSTIRIFSNDLNWTNFSTLPHAPVRVQTLQTRSDGSVGYLPADTTAPHLNTFSVMTDAAANGQCWTCLVNPLPVDMTGL